MAKEKEKENGYHRVTFTYEGKRYERKGKTLKEAHKKAAELKTALENGQVCPSGNMTVSRWAHEWLVTYKEPSVGVSQYKSYFLYIDNIIIPDIGNRKIKDIKEVELQKIINSRVGMSKSYLTKLRGTIKAIFKRAAQSHLIPYNPAEYLELPVATDGTRRSITDKEREGILELAKTHRAGLWVKMMLYCGLRPNETRALEWRHVDFEKKLIHVQWAMKAKTRDIGPPKSAAGIRDVPIPNVFYNDLFAAKGGPYEPVFAQAATGERRTESDMRRMWESFKRDLDISMGAKLYRNQITISALAPDLVPYCFRHTYCTDLQDKGVPINVAKYLMGHADISMTSKIYTHTTDKTLQDAADKINGESPEPLPKMNHG